jgi:hypothetical protein
LQDREKLILGSCDGEIKIVIFQIAETTACILADDNMTGAG